MSDPCAFCSLLADPQSDQLVWSDEQFAAFPDRAPMAAGHVLLIPRMHARTIYDLPSQLFTALFERIRLLGPALASIRGVDCTAIAVDGYGVPHAHIHIVPVTRGGQPDPCRQQLAELAERRRVTALLREGLAKATGSPLA